MRFTIFLAFFLFTCRLSYGQAAKYSNDFLSIGISAKGHGMANAMTAQANDVTAAFWNPAGLCQVQGNYEISLMHNEYFAGIAKFDYIGAAYKIDTNSTFSFSTIRFGVDDIPNTTDLMDSEGNFDYNRMSRFSVGDYAFITSYARKLPVKGLSAGVNAKVIYRNVGKFAKAYGFGIDAGLQYRHKNLELGAMFKDITGTFNAWNFNEEELIIETNDSIFNLPSENSLEITLPRLILGAAYNFKISPSLKLKGEIDLDITFDGKRHSLIRTNLISIDPYCGLELAFKNLIYARAGLGNIQDIMDFDGTHWSMQPNIGLGIHYKMLTFDYALANLGNSSGLGYSNVFSFKIKI